MVEKRSVDSIELQQAQKYHEQGNFDQARELYLNLLDNDPDHLNALISLGILENQCERLEEATKYFEKVCQIETQHVAFNYELAELYRKQCFLDKSIAKFQHLIQVNPQHIQSHLGLARCLKKLKQFDQAKAILAKLPLHYLEAQLELALIEQDQKQFDKAIELYLEILKAHPNQTEALINLGLCYQNKNNFNLSEDYYQKALALQANSSALWNNLGNLNRLKEKYQEAKSCYEKAIELDPDHREAHCNLGMLVLLIDENEELAWREHEWRNKPMLGNTKQWQGEDLQGQTILILYEQGFGDAIQCARYFNTLEKQAAKVFVECPGSLTELFKLNFPNIEFVEPQQEKTQIDYYSPMFSLPYYFSQDRYSFGKPYLKATPGLSTSRVSQPKIGFVWAGSSEHPNEQYSQTRRSISVHHFKNLFSLDSFSFYSLQFGEPAKELSQFSDQTNLSQIIYRNNCFLETASHIQSMDLLICIDTSIAHLAAALGKPTWVLLPKVPDWRWGLNLQTCKWYPSMRLFRQEQAGDWTDPLEKITSELKTYFSKSD